MPQGRFSLDDLDVSAPTPTGRFSLDDVLETPAIGTQPVAAHPRGLLEPGNVDLFKQPSVPNGENRSTVNSIGVSFDEGRETLLPQVTPDGRLLTPAQAVAEFKKTGRHLGVFSSPDAATEYAKQLHDDYAAGKYRLAPADARGVTDPASVRIRNPEPTIRAESLSDRVASKTREVASDIGHLWDLLTTAPKIITEPVHQAGQWLETKALEAGATLPEDDARMLAQRAGFAAGATDAAAAMLTPVNIGLGTVGKVTTALTSRMASLAEDVSILRGMVKTAKTVEEAEAAARDLAGTVDRLGKLEAARSAIVAGQGLAGAGFTAEGAHHLITAPTWQEKLAAIPELAAGAVMTTHGVQTAKRPLLVTQSLMDEINRRPPVNVTPRPRDVAGELPPAGASGSPAVRADAPAAPSAPTALVRVEPGSLVTVDAAAPPAAPSVPAAPTLPLTGESRVAPSSTRAPVVAPPPAAAAGTMAPSDVAAIESGPGSTPPAGPSIVPADQQPTTSPKPAPRGVRSEPIEWANLDLPARREVRRILAELQEFPYEPKRFQETVKQGGGMEVSAGAGGAPVYWDIVGGNPDARRPTPTFRYTRGEVAKKLAVFVESGKRSVVSDLAVDVAKRRLAGDRELSRPWVPGAAGDVPGSIPVDRLTTLDPARAAIQERAAHQLEEARPRELVTEYRARFDNVVSADQAKELFPEYAASAESRTANDLAVHRPASALAQRVYDELLQEPVPEGRDPFVILLAGGTGAGKSSSLEALFPGITQRAHVVYDSTLTNLDAAVRNIEAARNTNHAVLVALTERDVEEAFRATLERATVEGRPVTLNTHIKTHLAAPNVFQTLRARYPDGGEVEFAVIRSSATQGRQLVPLAEWSPKVYNEANVRAQLAQILDAEHGAGRVSDALRRSVSPPEGRQGATGTGSGRVQSDALPGRTTPGAPAPQGALTPADILDTGEAQPRLPEAGQVRDQNLPTPQFEAPFSLAPEADTTPRAVERDLFPGGGAGKSGGAQSMAQRGPAARPPTPGPLPDQQLRPSEIVQLLSKRLADLPVRVGKFRQHALGIYKPKAQVVRLKVANDLDVLAHEVGHHIDEALIGTGGSLLPGFRQSVSASRNPVINKELASLGQATSRPSYTAAQVRKEGAAEFLRFYLSDPAVLVTRAPNYLALFEDALTREPELRDVLVWARGQYQGYLALSPTDRVLTHIDFKGADDPSKGQTDWLTRLQTAWVDDLAPLAHAVRAMADGQPIDVLDDAYKLARLARGAPAKADGFLRFGPRSLQGERIGPSFEAALQPVKDRLREFTAYVVASRVVELKGRRGLETGIDLKDARAVVAALDSPTFQQARAALYTYQDGVLRYAEDAGVLAPEQTEAIRQANQFYVPFRRMQEALDGYLQGGGAARRLANRAVPIKRFRGSGVDIINPLESVIRNTHAIVDMVEKNRALQSLVAQARSTRGAGQWIEPIPPPQELTRVHLADFTRDLGRALDQAGVAVSTVQGPDGPQLEIDGNVVDLDQMVHLFTPAQFVKGEKGIITVVEDGKRQFYQVNNLALYDAITAIGPQASDLLITMFMLPARVLRAGATMTVGFLARNPMRDTFTAAVNTRYGFRPAVDTIRGLFAYLKKDELYQQFLNSGGGNSALLGPDRNRIREELAHMGLASRRRLIDSTVLNPMNLLRAVSEAGENATRLGEFLRGVQTEGQTPEGYARAALAARDVTIDFARGGRKAKEWNRIRAFFNANLQGMARIAEVMSGADARTESGQTRRERALEAAWRAMAAITVPTLALWYLNRDDPEYRELPAWEKLTYWHIPLGKGRGWARVPTPFELFTIFGAVPLAAMEWLYAKDPAVADQMFPNLESAWGTLISVMPTFVLPIVEIVTNYDTFRKRPIVSPWDMNLDVSLQTNRWTSALANDVGPKLGLAPAKFDHLVYGYLAGLGRTGVGLVDVARGAASDRATTGMRRWPVVGEPVNAFWREYAGTDAQSIQEVYETRDAIAGARSSMQRWRAGGQRDQADAKAAELQAQYGNPSVLQHRLELATRRLGTLRKDLDSIWAAEGMTPAAKQARQDRLFEEMVNTARRALGKPALRSRFETTAQEVGNVVR